MDSSLFWPHWTGGTVPSETDICCLPWRREALVWILWLRQPNWQDFKVKEAKGGAWVASLRDRETGHHIPTEWHKKAQNTELLHEILTHLSQHLNSFLLPLNPDTNQPTQSHSTVCNLDKFLPHFLWGLYVHPTPVLVFMFSLFRFLVPTNHLLPGPPLLRWPKSNSTTIHPCPQDSSQVERHIVCTCQSMTWALAWLSTVQTLYACMCWWTYDKACLIWRHFRVVTVVWSFCSY